MPKIHILPPEIIGKIAAGEVIERPASVVKELVENAIDAGATKIEIHLKEAGKILIHIKDDGTGIEKDDLEHIFSRHATSKIQSTNDLDGIRSLGFRGEALYSIGAIADVTLRSKTATQDTGWELHIRGGQRLNFKPVTMPQGTELEIKELFFNTPARKKFLKTNTAELKQILDVFIPYTLLYPERRFRLTHQGRDLIDLHPATGLLERAVDALNLETKDIIETRKDLPERDIAVRMALGNINIARARRDMQFIFVNGRPVQNRNIGFHLNQIYRLIFPPDKYPFFAVYINLPAGEVDVNIHPSKREVKIHNEQAFASLLRTMCEAALMSQGQAREVNAAQDLEANQSDRSSNNRSQPAIEAYESFISQAFEKRLPKETGSPAPQFKPGDAAHRQTRLPEIEEDFFIKSRENLKERLERARYIGGFIKKFLLFEVDRSILVVDQHAAQERITYEKLCAQIENGRIEIQNLLSPVLIKASAQEILTWEDAKDKLEKAGFATTQFDNQTVAIHSHPQLIPDTEGAVRRILAEKDLARCDPNTIARWACRSSIMTGDTMNKEQAEYQRRRLIECKDPFTCPHGRPTIIEISENFLDKQFLRK